MGINGFLYAIGAAITWGLVYVIDQKVLAGASPLVLVFLDSMITTIILLPLMVLQKDAVLSVIAAPRDMWGLIVASLVLAAVANFMIFSSIKIIGATTASSFEISYPFFVALFSYLAWRSTLSFHFFIGALLIFIGAAIIIVRGL